LRTHSILAAVAILIATAAVTHAASADAMCDDPPCTKRQIQAYQQRVQKHMLRTQNARFMAIANGQRKRAGRYDRQFKDTQKRWIAAGHALETAEN
jgi:hypothetical protein